MVFRKGAFMRKKVFRFLVSATISFSLLASQATAGVWVNDIHSQANKTLVDEIIQPSSIDDIRTAISKAKSEGKAVSISGGRHAMGGQQFGTGTILLDMSKMNRVLSFDVEKGLITVEAGIQWPELVNNLLDRQKDHWPQWGIRQKQTGADRLSIGGALSANVHGRGLSMKPFIDDVESFTLIDASGKQLFCSRTENSALFDLVIGGYGLFGVISSATLRLSRRTKIERVVEVIPISDLIAKVEQRKKDGFLFGDFQYVIDPKSDDFLARGVFSCYKPVDDARPMPAVQKELSNKNWDELYYLAHVDKKQAFERYSSYYLSTSGQLYWSDIHQMSIYNDNYHEALDKKLGTTEKGNEWITEIYVPRSSLVSFMKDAADQIRKNQSNVIYGTIRFIEKDDESFLAWAREPFACIIFNLHFTQSDAGIDTVAQQLRDLIDIAIKYHGGYYLTYHHFATRAQVDACYPQFSRFLQLKLKYDPEERFQSNWYRHYKKMFGVGSADK